MNNNINIGIIIPVFNGLSHTKNCLKNLEKISCEYQIVLVDDGSSDGTSQWVKENYPNVKLFYGDGNKWWSGSINIGMSEAFNNLNCTHVLWWNNDILAKEDYFSLLLEKVKQYPEIVVGAKIYIKDLDNIVWGMGGYFDTKTGRKEFIGNGANDSEEFNKQFSVDWLPGMGTIISKKVYQSVGLLDEKNFPQYHGDSDYTLKAKLNKHDIIVFPDLIIWNDKTNSGMLHNNSFKGLWTSLFSIRSNFNIKKDYLFYKIHTKSIIAYKGLFKKYFTYIAGFFKWKILGFIGVKKRK